MSRLCAGIFVLAVFCACRPDPANQTARVPGSPGEVPGAKADSDADHPASRPSRTQLAAALETDLGALRSEIEALSPERMRVHLRTRIPERRIPARLAELLRREMDADIAAEDMHYTRLVNALYADLDRLDPGGRSKAYVDGRIMAQPYMRALYAKVVVGLRRALSESEVTVDSDTPLPAP